MLHPALKCAQQTLLVPRDISRPHVGSSRAASSLLEHMFGWQNNPILIQLLFEPSSGSGSSTNLKCNSNWPSAVLTRMQLATETISCACYTCCCRFCMPQLGAYFDIEGRNTYLTAELRAGCVAFLTVSSCQWWRQEY